MKTCRKLQQFIQQLAEKHGVDLNTVGAYLRLDMKGAEHYLVIETLGACRVSIARYLVSSLGRVADPEIVLYTAYPNDEQSPEQRGAEWVPTERLQRYGGWAIYADIDSLGMLIRVFDAQGQRDLAEFIETYFVHELQAQGWLTHGCRSTAPKPYLTLEEQWLRGITFAYNDEPADSATSGVMQKVALRLAADHGVDLSQADIQLVLALPHRPEQLVLMNWGDDRISVTRCVVEDAGQIAPDPDLIFRVTDTGGWQPEELLYSPEVWAEYVASVDEAAVYTPGGEVNFMSFTEYWAQRLIDEGWVNQSKKLFEFSTMSDVDPTPRNQCQVQGIPIVDEGSVQLVCDCLEFGSECGTWLELTPDGFLILEDRDGLRISFMLPEWLEVTIRSSMHMYLQNVAQLHRYSD